MSSFKEHRGTSLAGVVIAVLIPAAVWWACLSTDSLVFAWACALATALGTVTVTLVRALQTVEVTPDAFCVGKAHLESRWIGAAEAFDGVSWQNLVRSGGGHSVWLDARSFHPGGIKVENTDPDDPVDSWLVSSRDSIALAEALKDLARSSAISEDRKPNHG